jgi:hypothetical protein
MLFSRRRFFPWSKNPLWQRGAVKKMNFSPARSGMKTGVQSARNAIKKHWIPAGVYPVLDTGPE